MNNTANTHKYCATVSYPKNSNQPFEFGYGATIEEAERRAIEQSAVNVARRVTVETNPEVTGDLFVVKGPYMLRVKKAVR